MPCGGTPKALSSPGLFDMLLHSKKGYVADCRNGCKHLDHFAVLSKLKSRRVFALGMSCQVRRSLETL